MVTELDDFSHVKIGYTGSLDEVVDLASAKKRLSGLQTSTWRALVCIGACDGGEDVERALHQRFSAHRVAGEWFSNRDDLAEWVESVMLTAMIRTQQGVSGVSHERRMEMHTFMRNAHQREMNRKAAARAAARPAEPVPPSLGRRPARARVEPRRKRRVKMFEWRGANRPW